MIGDILIVSGIVLVLVGLIGFVWSVVQAIRRRLSREEKPAEKRNRS